MCSSLTPRLVVDGGECPLDLVITKPRHEPKERAAVTNVLDAQIRGMSAVTCSVVRPEEGSAGTWPVAVACDLFDLFV